MNIDNDILLDAQYIYKNCIDIKDAKELMRSNFWRDLPSDYKRAVWCELISICETRGYFE